MSSRNRKRKQRERLKHGLDEPFQTPNTGYTSRTVERPEQLTKPTKSQTSYWEKKLREK